MRAIKIYLGITCFILFSTPLFAQHKLFNETGAGNPIIPGYFADPTVKKFGDTYYIYATTDGNGGGFGPAQAWISKDFVNWSLQDMNWPTTHYYWAPDVTQAPDGKYYMYYCQPVEIFGAWATTPVGPWTPLLPPGEPVVKNFLVPNVITLDGQTFRDDDGKMYMFWGTWGIYPDHGCGVGLLNPDMKSFAKLAKIPNTVAKDFFEAPFMFKRNGLYYLTYSSGRCEDDTYRVQYAVSKTGPMGPFVYGKNNPVLTTSGDGTVHGPGHQSVLQEGKEFYLIYHRHNNPHSGGGYHRQVAADQLVFDAEGNIEKLVPAHEGIGFFAKNSNPSVDHLMGKTVTASSVYSEDFKPEFVVDHNNGTLWKPQNNTSASWLQIDMGAVKNIKSIQTQFEYATWYYQYLIEYSIDGKLWQVFADQTKNTVHGSPMIDTGNVKARYLRLTITNTEYPGLNKAVWNIRAFSDDLYHPHMSVKAKDPASIPAIKPQGLLIDLDASKFEQGAAVAKWGNAGKLGGAFLPESDAVPTAQIIGGKKAVIFAGKTSFRSDVTSPLSLSGNSSFTVSMWLNNPVIEDEEPVVSWTDRGGVDMTNATIGYGSNKRWGAAAHWGWADMPYKTLPAAAKWHHIALVFDGTYEKLYVDGVLDRKELKMLFLANLTKFIIGSTADKNAFFSGAIASLKVYDTALGEQEVKDLAAAQNNSDVSVYLDASKLPYGQVAEWKNEGFFGGSFVAGAANDLPTVADCKGKIAVVFKGKAKLDFNMDLPGMMKNSGSYAVVYDVLAKEPGKDWHQIIKVYQGNTSHTYIDGILNDQQKLSVISISNDNISIGASDKRAQAVASVMIYNHSFNEAEVAGIYQSWQKNFITGITAANFKQQPKALSTTMVTMSAEAINLPGRIYQYNFTELTGNPGGASSGWLDEPDYINYGLMEGQDYVYTLKVKDNYGNVTAATSAVKVKTNKDLFAISANTFDVDEDFSIIALPKPLSALPKSQAATPEFWDGLIGKADTAQSRGGTLKLASTNTKWDGDTPKGPFLYKNVTGDFIVETEVTDVSGLKEKKANGANDAGLMVCADSSLNLLQNSIFPGWGIGNIVTSLNSQGRAQTNNQSAWNFYKHLQIQRSGKVFYLRGSTDGQHWKDLPGSPILRPDFKTSVQVGLYHATYGAQSGYGVFDNFKLIQVK